MPTPQTPMPGPSYGQLPSIQDVLGPGGAQNAGQGDIFKLLQTQQPTMMSLMPQIQAMLGSQSQFMDPVYAQIRQGAQSNEASAQSDAMKRGLTGSDIELANMRGARQAGEQQIAQTAGQMGMQQAAQMAQYMMQAAGMDIQSNHEMFVTLAQAIGQKLSMQQDMTMAQMMSDAAARQAHANQNASLFGSGIGAAGMLGAGALIGFSDSRLKEDLHEVARADGLPVVSFRWNAAARCLGAPAGRCVGVRAEDVARRWPHLVGWDGGYSTVNYSGLPGAVRAAISAAGGH